MPARHLRCLALSSSALCALTLAQPAAASCVESVDVSGNPVLTCAGTGSDRVNDDRSDLTVMVTDSGEIVRENGRAVQFGGDRVTVDNAGLIESRGDNDGIRSSGSDLTVDNAGTITGTDRGIRLTDGEGRFTLFNRESGEIRSRRQAVRLDNDALLSGNLFENRGLIDSSEGRAIQSRGPGNVVINHASGVMRGGEEVIEGRMDFTVENHGLIALHGLDWDPDTRTWTNSGATEDEDGIQFASGMLDNHGVILATDDGLDIDEGTLLNRSTGVIVSAGPNDLRNSAAVDIDGILQDPGGPRDGEIPGPVTIVNEGYMEGPTGIAAALDAVHEIEIANSGTLIGRGGNAIDLAPGQGDTTIALFGMSVVQGDILFGNGGLNTLILGPFETGAAFDGTVSARGPGDLPGVFDVAFGDGVGIGDFYSYLFADDRFTLGMRAGADRLSFDLFGAAGFTLDGSRYAPDEFAALLRSGGVGVIPLPAGIWLLLGGLGFLAGLARARRTA